MIDEKFCLVRGLAIVTQQQSNRLVERLFAQLTAKANIAELEQLIQKNITIKRRGVDEQAFFDRLMLNLTYYQQNELTWKEISALVLSQKMPAKTSVIEDELLAAQMRIRQQVEEQKAQLIPLFHEQYNAELTTDIMIYDYAYASIAHALRIDFITLVTLQEASVQETLFAGEALATLAVIDGYVNYYADQHARQLTLV